MMKKAVKPIALLLIFICAIAIFSTITNKENIDMTVTMDEATLPVMYFRYNNHLMHELHGYSKEMDMLSMRDSVLPIGSDRTLHMELMTYGEDVSKISFEIRSIDGGKLIMEEDSAEFTSTGDKLTCEIPLSSLFDEQVEYNMVIYVTMEGRDIIYYTRIMRGEECYVDECLEFALTFHDYTFRPDAASFIPTYMDPATGDATKLSYVDLTCTLRQITWADFEGSKITEPVAAFKEINNSYNVITLNYVITNVNENNEVEYYNVEEYYRLRNTSTRMYVLNFERRMNQIFRGENDFFNGKSALLLGIRDGDVEYKSNEAGDAIAFVQEGELWSYERNNNSLSQIFSFRGREGIDSRENWHDHDIKIVSVDEAGSVEFIVYGYMNRGHHEGEVGIGVYRYDALARTVEEDIFITTDKSFEKLKAELGELMYVNEKGHLYLMASEDVYRIHLDSMSVEKIIETANGTGFVISEDNRFIAWVDAQRQDSSTEMTLMDLQSERQCKITLGTDKYLKPLAFMGNDLVYGVANITDVVVDEVGNTQFPFCRLEIVNYEEESLKTLKSYYPSSGHVGNVVFDRYDIYVDLLTKTETGYEKTGTDTIMNRETEVVNKVELGKIVTEEKQTQILITMKAVSDTANVRVITPRYVMLDAKRQIEYPDNKADMVYYVYVKGDVLLATTNRSQAIICANRNYGVVVDENMRYIFKRARSTSQNAISGLVPSEEDKDASGLAKCISALLKWENSELSVGQRLEEGQTPYYILSSILYDAEVVELRGCQVDELLYYVDMGKPVLAKTGEQDAVLLTGYTSSRIYYFDPATGTTKNVTYEAMDQMLYKGGNYFILYLR